MVNAGPGAYNLNSSTYIVAQNQTTNSFVHNHTKLQEILTLKKESMKMKENDTDDFTSRSKSVMNVNKTFGIVGKSSKKQLMYDNDSVSPRKESMIISRLSQS